MSVGLTLNTAISGLQANQAALTVISNNISNVNTQGYTAKSVNMSSRVLDGAGRGVEIANVDRFVDARLQAELRATTASMAMNETTSKYFARTQDLFGSPDSNSSISNNLADLAAAISALSATPESPSLQTSAINDLQQVTSQITSMSDTIQNLRLDADREISANIDDMNVNLKAIAKLNLEISTAMAQGINTADLADKRDTEIATLAENMDFSYYTRSTGEVVIFTKDGLQLADTSATPLSHNSVTAMGASSSYAGGQIDGIDLRGRDITNQFGDGAIAALVEMRDSTLPDLQAELDRLTEMLRNEVNELHNQGTSFPAPNSLTGTRSFADTSVDTVTLTSDTRIGVLDSGGDFVDYYDLPAGSYTVDAIAAAINTNLGANATASTANGNLQIGANNAVNSLGIVDLGDQQVTFGADTYNGLSYFFGLNDLLITGGNSPGDAIGGIAGGLKIRSDIVTTESYLARGTLNKDSGANAPALGQSGIGMGDNSIMVSLSELFEKPLVFGASGDLPNLKTTLSGYAGEIIGNNSVAANRASKDTEFQQALFEEISYRYSSSSAVNLDLELSNMIVFQNAYQASAQVVNAAQEMLDTLLNILR
jgi:flagellar hook-associated protein 1 FlgK|tara:strand:+ start:11609 stop:13405 length:1797 start_codon:yes stop_codon:yes gene_type:complete